jgi:serine/threonine protein kinase/Tfp pilus assembly protein PilF
MKPGRLEQIDGIFQTAIDLPPEERREFLDVACANDAELRSEVESLISSHEASGGFIDGSAADVAAMLLAGRSLSGRQVAQYNVGGLLGSGGMGEVYQATDRMGRKVALKVLAPRFVADRQHVTRFLQEARAVLALNHPNIVTVYDIGEADGTYYIASELIEGETLRSVLASGPPPLAQAVDVAIQVCTALAAAHDKGIVHRDIKPENVMLRVDGYVKVLDFGIAKLTERFGGAGAARTQAETVAGLIVGTTPYMSPEQARGAAVDARSDIWSSGILLYEMLCGRNPFAGGSTPEVLARILERAPEPLGAAVDGLPEEMQRIVTRALAKDPDQRYPAMTAILADLKAVRQDLEFGEKIRHLHTTGEAVGAGARSRTRVVTAWAIVAGAVALGVAYFTTPLFRSPSVDSVAVLPFVNATGDPALEYLSDGMTESLINALGGLPDVAVKARSMVFRYKGREMGPQEVASELAVEAVLTGQLERRGDRLALSLALANGRDGDHLWGERYEITMSDLVAVQSGMARDIAERLHTRLSGAEQERVARAYTASGEAYQLYLKGRYHVQKVALPEVQTGIKFLEEATALDPNYALAYVGLADAYRTASAADVAPDQVIPQAKRAAERAVQIDDNLSSAHVQLAMLASWYDWDPVTAERHFQRALELDADNAEARLFYAHLLSNQGRHDEALAEASRALALEPFNSRFSALSGQFLVHAGHADEAIERLQATIALDPNHVLARIFISTAYVEKRMYAEAIREAQAAIDRTRRRMSHPIGIQGYAYARSGDTAKARELLDELLAAARTRYVAPYSIALIYNALGEGDQTMAWLERGFEARDHKMNLLKVDPKWKNLHGDPRFQDLVRRIGF